MKSTKCNSIQRLLSDYIDGILPDDQKNKINQHLASCSKCREALKSLEKTNRILNLYVEREPPEEYFDSLWIQIENKINSQDKKRDIRSSLRDTIRDVFTLVGLKFRMLENRLFDEIVWWTDRISWNKLLWKSTIIILLVVSAVAIDRTYFRTSIDKTLLKRITQSLSEEGFYIVKYTPNTNSKHQRDVSRKPRHENWGIQNEESLKTRRLYQKEHLSVFSPYSSENSIEVENGFLTIVGNIEISKPGEAENYILEEKFNQVNLYSPKDIAQVKITRIRDLQSQTDIMDIQDIQESFRRKSNSESPFKVFFTDVETSELTFKNFN